MAVPLSGDLEKISKELGMTQEQVVAARREQLSGQVTGESGSSGDMERASYAERSALPTTGASIGTADYYSDNGRGVQVFAPHGSYFELYGGGGVKSIQGKAPKQDTGKSSLFTQTTTGDEGNKQAVAGITQDKLAYTPITGKTIARTGQTIKNPTTGVDEYAGEGETLIEYTDGTVERRKVGGTPGSAVPIGEFGRTAQELGITRKTEIKGGAGSEITRAPMTAAEALAAAKTPEEADKIIQAEGLTSTSNLELIGSDYQPLDKNGQPIGPRRKAKEGYAFFQEPGSDRILERPVSLSGMAKQTTSPSILSERKKLEGSITKHLPKENLEETEEDFKSNPMDSFAKMYAKLQEAQGVSTIKSEIEKIQAEQKSLDEKHAEEKADIDSNPWLSESLRSRKQAATADKYETSKAQLTARLQMNSTLLQNARQESQFIAQNALEQYNADRSFDFNMLKFEAERQDAAIDAEYKIRTLAQSEKNANIKEVQGGLYDLKAKKWIISPKADKPDSLTANAYAGIVSDIYQTYDAADADQIISDITSKIGLPGEPLSIQSIVPRGEVIGTKFGESTFMQAHHSGVDMPAPMGSPVLAPIEMKVTSLGTVGAYGNSIVATGSDGNSYRFAHLAGFNVAMGQTVKAGVQIGKVGSTGSVNGKPSSTGAHLHMEVMDKSGKFKDPVDHFGLTVDKPAIKTRAQKQKEAEQAATEKKERDAKILALNKEIVSSDPYKVIRKGQESLQYLNEFETVFKKYGLGTIPGTKKGELSTTYMTSLLNLKEFFNLGVLAGPDLDVLMGIIPSPTEGFNKKLTGRASAITTGITNMKKNIEMTLDDRYQSIASQHSGYTSEELGVLKDLNRIYINQKSALNPKIKAKVDAMRKENNGLTDEEIIQIIL